MSDETTELDPIDVLVEEYSSKLRTGSAPSVEDFARQHPKEAGELRDLLPTVVAMEEIKKRRQSGQPLTNTTAPERVGDFQILREIGRGGMGIVYEAQEHTLNRRVALKILPGHALMSNVRIQRFQREAQTAAQLHHTNIVPVFGFGEADGLHYYIMQFIEGRSLHQIVEQSIREKHSKVQMRSPPKSTVPISRPGAIAGNGAGPGRVSRIGASELSFIPPDSGARQNGAKPEDIRNEIANAPDFRLTSGAKYWRWAAHVAVQVADALYYAHSHGVVHRDIKPANILIDAQDTAWITDFGLAKLGDHDSLTRSGDLLGTLQYMAPETFKGTYDARADVYSLGLTLYEIMTRRPPYSETTAAGLIHEISMHEPVHPRKVDATIPEDLETIVLKAAARAPEQRYQTAAALAEDLRRFLDDRPILARKAGAVERAVRWCRRNRTVATLSGLTVAAMFLAMAVGWVGYSRTSSALQQVAHEADAARSAENRADANVEMSLQALEEMFEQLNGSSEFQDQPRTPTVGTDKPEIQKQGPQSVDKPPVPPPGDDKNPNNAPRQPGDKGPPQGQDRSPRGPRGFGMWSTGNVGLVQSILAFYERFAEKNATNAKLRLESARAYERVGELQMHLHEKEKAEQAFRKSLATIEQLAAKGVTSPSLSSVAAKARARLGDLFLERKEYETSAHYYTQAIEMLTPLAATDERFRQDLAQSRLNYAGQLTQEAKYEDAIALLRAITSPGEEGGTYKNERDFIYRAYRRLTEIYDLKGDTQASKEAGALAQQYQPNWGRRDGR